MLDKLRSSAEYLDKFRIEQCTKSVIEGYTRATNIKDMAKVVKERTIEDLRFRTMSLHLLIDKDKFLAPNYHWGHYFTDVGRAIARGEEKYIHRRISSISAKFDEEIYHKNTDFTVINKGIRRLLGRNISPNIMLMPIELHNDFVKRYREKLDWPINAPPLLTEQGCNLKVYWSNKYAPLKSIMIFDSNAGIWHVLEDKYTQNNIAVAIGESEQSKDKIAYFVGELAYYYVVNKEAFIKIPLSR